MLISGEKVRLRPATPNDFPQMITWSRDEEVNRYLEGEFPKTIDEYSVWLKKLNSDRHAKHFAIVTLPDSRLIGDIQLDHITWRSGDAELRIRIGERHLWDKGYGTDAIVALLQHAFENMTLSRIYLRVFSSNLRAIRCYEKAGFRKEGRLKRRSTDGQMKEIILMSILRDQFLRSSPSSQDARIA